jgi:predicted glycosyltransferase
MGDQLQHSYAVERAGLVTVLRERDLTRHRLQTAIEVTTASPRPQRFVNTGGAEYTARYLLSLASPTTRGDT